jgi:hypothetical protein
MMEAEEAFEKFPSSTMKQYSLVSPIRRWDNNIKPNFRFEISSFMASPSDTIRFM